MELHVLTISRKPSGNPDHPYINIGGKWLEKNGFTIGEKVLVEAKKVNIRIRSIKFTEQEDSDISFKVDR